MRLLYKSVTTPDVTDAGMDEIIAAAQLKNAERGISGFLVWRKPAVVQVLEGESAEVINLLQVIRTDARHSNLAVVYSEDAPATSMPEWSMKYWNMGRDVMTVADQQAVKAVFPDHFRIIMMAALSL